MGRFVLILGIVLASTSSGAATLDDLSWMRGHWRSESDRGITEELWMPAEGSVMLGLNRVIQPGKRAFFEFLRIEERDGAIDYVAQPGGAAPTSFRLVSIEAAKAVFENLEHDFPQRIIYRLDDGKLCARIEGVVSGKESSQGWCWAKVAD